MVEYKEEIKKLLTSLYEQGNPVDHDAQLSTREIYYDLLSLLPEKAIDEYDVYEVLSSLYTPFYVSSSKYEVVMTSEGTPKIIENKREGVKFLWHLKRI